MPSPFPGMDPFIESQKWEDFHTSFMVALADALTLLIRPHYVVDVQRREYRETNDASLPFPNWIVDAGVDRDKSERISSSAGAIGADSVIERKIFALPYVKEHREAYLIIRRLSPSRVVTVIELLSPTNKAPRTDGHRIYTDKRMELLQTGDPIPTSQPLIAATRRCCALVRRRSAS